MIAKTSITGPAVCPSCQLEGRDALAHKASQLDDGRILCLTCGSVIAPFDAHALTVSHMPFSIQSLVMTLLRGELHGPSLKVTYATFGPDGSPSQAEAATAQDAGNAILNYGSLLLWSDPLATLQVRFHADELQEVPADFAKVAVVPLPPESEQFLRNLQISSCPHGLRTAIAKLLSLGFAVRHFDFKESSMRRVLLHCGGNIAGTNFPKGIMVDATYMV